MLRVDPDSAEPPFAQLCTQLTEQITAGTLQAAAATTLRRDIGAPRS